MRPEPDGVRVVVCSGEFDLDAAGMAAACDHDAAGARLLVVDVAGVTFADSSFLNVLIRPNNSAPWPWPGHCRTSCSGCWR
ncbi:STAS domain-containing protein [Streptomyces sp. NPDC001581]|uniref:STAS domain-containing protein n=1 Tax=Streptomyces sp. NPDC001581 TaxID=3154386 RepID=UPI0033193E75